MAHLACPPLLHLPCAVTRPTCSVQILSQTCIEEAASAGIYYDPPPCRILYHEPHVSTRIKRPHTLPPVESNARVRCLARLAFCTSPTYTCRPVFLSLKQGTKNGVRMNFPPPPPPIASAHKRERPKAKQSKQNPRNFPFVSLLPLPFPSHEKGTSRTVGFGTRIPYSNHF